MVEDAAGKRLPFHTALLAGDLASAQDLFESGNQRDLLTRPTPGKGWRSIHFACRSGSNEAVSLGFVCSLWEYRELLFGLPLHLIWPPFPPLDPFGNERREG